LCVTNHKAFSLGVCQFLTLFRAFYQIFWHSKDTRNDTPKTVAFI